MAKTKDESSYHPFYTHLKFLTNKLVVAAFKKPKYVIHHYLKTKEMLIMEITIKSQKDIRSCKQSCFQFVEDT